MDRSVYVRVLTTPEDVGVYGVAFKYSTLAVVFLLAINSIATPEFAEFHAKNDIQGLEKTVKHHKNDFLSYHSWCYFCIFCKWFGFSGESFVVGVSTLLILLAGRFYSSICGSVISILQMTGNQHLFQNILLVAAIVNVV